MYESEQHRSTAADQSPANQPEWQLLEKVATASIDEQRKARRWGVFFKLLTFAYLFILLLALVPMMPGDIGSAAEEHVALVELNGVIAADSEASANTVVAGLRSAFEAEQSVGVILAINSPGGSPVQAGYINDEINRLRALHEDKKIYAVIADLGASGGYYVAAAADQIYADKASLVGSIGVISGGFGFDQLMEKVGLDRRIYTAGDNKAFLDPFSPEKESDKAFWEQVLKVTHRQFVDVVKTGRGERLLDSPEVFSGLIWTGEQALAMGLVDGLGSAGHVAREVIGTEDIIDYTRRRTPFEDLVGSLGAKLSTAFWGMFGKQPLMLQ